MRVVALAMWTVNQANFRLGKAIATATVIAVATAVALVIVMAVATITATTAIVAKQQTVFQPITDELL